MAFNTGRQNKWVWTQRYKNDDINEWTNLTEYGMMNKAEEMESWRV